MEGEGNICDYRRKLDRTLASPDLTNHQMLEILVKDQMSQSSRFQTGGYAENVVKRSKEVSNFLSMLRSASLNDIKSSDESHHGWKDTEEFRVMYREGPEGTPFHTLLVEGYVDGPLDVCLCISWESGLYKKWWPQTAVPTFKVISSQCLQRVGTGEQISLVRTKVSWPLSSREALVHYFAFEYFQDDLIVVLLNSISDSETIDMSTHGFTQDGIPDAKEVVRIDMVGGFALQKVTADRSYFRTIANMDIKLDFVPPSVINFISRQLVGSGFKLYKKEVASVSRGEESFCEALKDPLFARIREALYSGNTEECPDEKNLKRSTTIMVKDQNGEPNDDDNAEESRWCNDSEVVSESKDIRNKDSKVLNEIEELAENDPKDGESLDNCAQKPSIYSTVQSIKMFRAEEERFLSITEEETALRTTNGVTENYVSEVRKKVAISPQVTQALETLEKAISLFRGHSSSPEEAQHGISRINLANLEKEAVEESMSSEADQMSSENRNFDEPSNIGSQELNSPDCRSSSDCCASRQSIGSNSYQRETSEGKSVPDDDLSSPSDTNQIASKNHTTASTVSQKITENCSLNADADGHDANIVTKRKNRRSRICCFHSPFA